MLKSNIFFYDCEFYIKRLAATPLDACRGNKCGKTMVCGFQSSARGGIVECILKEQEQKVCIVGTAVTAMSGGKIMIGA